MVFAQDPQSQDFFFRSGKYYVVVAVLVILFLILFVYLIRMDKRIKKLERSS
jgi:CcmD family protein